MNDVRETLERLSPKTTRTSDWDAVVRDARLRTRSIAVQLAVVTVIAAVAALFVVSPWQGSERVGVLDQALAAVGDGPVLHVVLRGEWGGTQVDLKTGERKPIYGEDEIWYDANRNLVHQISRFGDVVESEEFFSPEKADTELRTLAAEYRRALANGTARVSGKGSFDGAPVFWVTIRRQMLPDVGDHRDHEFAQEVAISTATHEPVAIHTMRDRKVFDTERIVTLESLDLSESNFVRHPEASMDGRAVIEGSHPIAIQRAFEVLGRSPYWLGPTFSGLPLARAEEAVSRIGSVPTKTLLTGARAQRFRQCIQDRLRRTCPRTGGVIQQAGDKIYLRGRSTLGPLHTGVSLFYGSVGDNPGTFKKDVVPLRDRPNVVVTETADPELRTLGSGRPHYVPPSGSLLLGQGGWGFLFHDGLYITIQAGSHDRILAAARSLTLMPAGR